MENGCEPTRTSESLGDVGGCQGGIDCDGHEKDEMVRVHEHKVEPIAMVMRRMKWFGFMNTRWNRLRWS